MTDGETTQQPTTQRVRRRASRPAGPAKTESAGEAAVVAPGATTVKGDAPAEPKRPAKKKLASVKPPRRRQPYRFLVGWVSFAAALLAIGALVGCVTALVMSSCAPGGCAANVFRLKAGLARSSIGTR